MDARPPRDVVLRDAEPHDVEALAALHVRTFNETHGPGPPLALRVDQWRTAFSKVEDTWFCVVLEHPDRSLIGFAKGQPYIEAEHGEFGGELNKIYLLRAFHRQGLGRRLLCAVAYRFLERGITSMLLFGDARSPTNGFYEAMGGEKLLAPSGAFHGGYGWRALDTLARHCAGVSRSAPSTRVPEVAS